MNSCEDGSLALHFPAKVIQDIAMKGAAVFVLVLVCLMESAWSQTIPANGTLPAELTAFETEILNYMDARSIPAGAFCLIRNGQVHINRSYGHMDQSETVEVQPNALFRVASLSKPITNAAIFELEASGLLQFTDFVFDRGQPEGGHLSIVPFGTPDSRLEDITIQHLLDHKGGWDSDISGDPMFKAIEIAGDLGVPSPPGQVNTVRWNMGKSLDHDPGTTYAYSNFGYLLLGLIIEEVTGQDYVSWIQENLFARVGVLPSDVELGRSLVPNRNPREPWYSNPGGSAANVFNPGGPQVPWPDGGWDLETMEAHGGLIMTAEACARFGDAWWTSGWRRGTDNTGLTWNFNGSLDGTTAFLSQRNGVVWAAFFNQRNDASGLDYFTLRSAIEQVQDGIASWPAEAELDLPVNGTPITGTDRLDLEMTTYMKANRLTAGILTMQKDGQVVYNRSFGWKDHTRTEPLFPHALVRTGSISKPVTAALVRKLDTDGLLSLTDKVFDVGQPGGGILDLNIVGVPDARLQNITVQHFMDHLSGLDPAFSDPTSLSRQIADELGVAHPPSRIDMARWIAGKPLANDPGADENYANVGYLFLSLVVEEVTGNAYLDDLRTRIFAPMGVGPDEVQFAEPFPVNRNVREPFYDSDNWGASKYFPDNQSAQFVTGPNGLHYHEAAVGSQIMMPRTLARFMADYSLTGETRPAPGGWAYVFFGAYSGTSMVVRQNGSGIDYAVWFNQDGNPLPAGEMADILNPIVANNEVTFPASVPPDPPVSVSASDGVDPKVVVSWAATPGATSYSVYRHSSNSRDDAIQVTGGLVNTTWTDEDSFPGQIYFYWVKAHNAAGESGFSPVDSGFTVPIPDTPTGVDASDGSSPDHILVTWNGSNGASTYELWRHDADDPGSAIQLATGITDLTYTDDTVSWGEVRYYWIKAVNSAGIASPFSAPDQGWRAITAPQGLTLDTGNSQRVRLSWDIVPGAQTHRILRGTVDDVAQATEIGEGNDTFFDDTTATPGQLYYWFAQALVRPLIDEANGPVSESLSGRRVFPPPANLGATPDDPDWIDVGWDTVPGLLTNYEVRKSSTSNFFDATAVATPSTPGYRDTTVPSGLPFYFWVRAYSAETQGEWAGPVEGYRGGVGYSVFVDREGIIGDDALPGNDPNSDGVNNLLAVAADLPLAGDAMGRKPIVSYEVDRVTGKAILVYRRVAVTLYGITYRVIQSSNLVDWNPVDFSAPENTETVLPDDPDGDGSVVWVQAEVGLPVDLAPVFLKLEAVQD